jgi:hypothetical protein
LDRPESQAQLDHLGALKKAEADARVVTDDLGVLSKDILAVGDIVKVHPLIDIVSDA